MRRKTNENYANITLNAICENILKEIELSAKLNYLSSIKESTEIVNTKINNQLNSMKVSILKINPKFAEKSKKYDDINNKMLEVLDDYELVLKFYCSNYDEEIKNLILKKVELEYKLLISIIERNYIYRKDNKIRKNDNKLIIHSITTVAQKIKAKYVNKEQMDVSLINKIRDEKDVNKEINEKKQMSEEYRNNYNHIMRLESEIKKLNKKIIQKNEEKINNVYEALEVGNRELSTEIRKPKTFKKIKHFFVNKFNTYNVILKKVIEPLKNRVDEFKINTLKNAEPKYTECDFDDFEESIKETQNLVFDNIQNKEIIQGLKFFQE